jgi:hypothetical protein
MLAKCQGDSPRLPQHLAPVRFRTFRVDLTHDSERARKIIQMSISSVANP